ncbi:MAG: spore coat protein [Candidatus Latescibacteria bacterium]|nr:spore coat protein [Candidatus Latescibacterota bacterium]
MSDTIFNGKIADVRWKRLRVFADDRGFFAELLRADDPFFGGAFAGFGQTAVTMSYPGVIKAFHWHRRQDDAWFVLKGMAQVVLHDLREGAPTKGQTEVYYMGEQNPILLVIPRGVAHGYRVLGQESVYLVYHVTQPYDPKDPDEQRVPHDDPAIGFDWTTKMR